MLMMAGQKGKSMDIKDKVAKLLALATSPNEHEAQEALMKARELMVKYKLRPEEVGRTENLKVVIQTIGVECTKMTDVWAPDLAAVIAQHYCCKAYRQRMPRSKKVEIGFAGLEDDFEICKRIFLYAYDCVKSHCKEIKVEHQRRGWNATAIREMCNAYGWGFVDGLEEAFNKQEEAHQEWGLVMVVPQAVEEATANQKKPSTYGEARTSGWLKKYAMQGYEEGQTFDPSTKLENPVSV